MIGLGPKGEGAPRQRAQGLGGGLSLKTLAARGPEARAAAKKGERRQSAKLRAKLVIAGHDQRPQLLQSRAVGAHRPVAGEHERAQPLPGATDARLGQGPPERLTSGALGIKLVILGAIAPRRPARAIDLTDALSEGLEVGQQPSAVAARTLDRPKPWARGEIMRSPQGRRVPVSLGADAQGAPHDTATIEHSDRMLVAVGVDADEKAVLADPAGSGLTLIVSTTCYEDPVAKAGEGRQSVGAALDHLDLVDHPLGRRP